AEFPLHRRLDLLLQRRVGARGRVEDDVAAAEQRFHVAEARRFEGALELGHLCVRRHHAAEERCVSGHERSLQCRARMTKRGWILFLALGVIWGMPYLLIRIAVASIDPLVVAFGRTLIGSLILLPVALNRGVLKPALTHWRWLLVFTLIEISLPWLL